MLKIEAIKSKMAEGADLSEIKYATPFTVFAASQTEEV